MSTWFITNSPWPSSTSELHGTLNAIKPTSMLNSWWTTIPTSIWSEWTQIKLLRLRAIMVWGMNHSLCFVYMAMKFWGRLARTTLAYWIRWKRWRNCQPVQSWIFSEANGCHTEPASNTITMNIWKGTTTKRYLAFDSSYEINAHIFIILYSCTVIEILITTERREGEIETEKGIETGIAIIDEKEVLPETIIERKEGDHVRIQIPGIIKKVGVAQGKKGHTWRTMKKERYRRWSRLFAWRSGTMKFSLMRNSYKCYEICQHRSNNNWQVRRTRLKKFINTY